MLVVRSINLPRLAHSVSSQLRATFRTARRTPRAPLNGRVLASMIDTEFKDFLFGPWTIHASEVFVTSPLSFAFVNLKPVVPGHVLVSPKRVVARFAELTPEEVGDLWCLSQRVGSALQSHFGSDSQTLTIQDGPSSGQTVAHVHVHILPRKPGDFEHNDQVYDAIDESSKALPRGGEHLDLDKERKPRTSQEMAAEAAELRKLFQ